MVAKTSFGSLWSWRMRRSVAFPFRLHSSNCSLESEKNATSEPEIIAESTSKISVIKVSQSTSEIEKAFRKSKDEK